MADLHSSPISDWLEGSVGHSISAVEAYVGQCVAVLHGAFVWVCVYRVVAYSGSPPALSFRVREKGGGGGSEGEGRGRSRPQGLFYPVCALTTLNALVFSLRLVTNIWSNFF